MIRGQDLKLLYDETLSHSDIFFWDSVVSKGLYGRRLSLRFDLICFEPVIKRYLIILAILSFWCPFDLVAN